MFLCGVFSLSSDAARPPALVPVHLYSQLACHTEGCEILERTGYIQDYSTLIRNSIAVCKDITKVKAAVWAVVSCILLLLLLLLLLFIFY